MQQKVRRPCRRVDGPRRTNAPLFQKSAHLGKSLFSIGRSFDLSIVEKEENGDLFDEFLSLVRLYDKSSFATLSEKMYTFVLCALNRRKLHLFWKVISTYGE